MLLGDAHVLAATAAVVRQLQGLGIAYDDLFSPLVDEALAAALRRLTIRASGHALGADRLELVTPPLHGRYLLLYATEASTDRRRFALRHGMGHVAAGHVDAPSFLAVDGDWTAHAERVADLFALADLVPFHQVAQLKRGSGWRAVRDEVARQVRSWTPEWPEPRVQDRAALRVALYRESGL